MLELIEGYWAEVGIEMKSNVIDRSLGQQRLDANEHDANVWGGPGGIGYGTLLDPRNFVPVHGHSRYAYAVVAILASIRKASWLRSRRQPCCEQFELYRAALATADPEEQTDLMKQIDGDRGRPVLHDRHLQTGARVRHRQEDLKNVMDNMPVRLAVPDARPERTRISGTLSTLEFRLSVDR